MNPTAPYLHYGQSMRKAGQTCSLLSFNREQIMRKLISVITGLWPVGTYARRIGVEFNDYYGSCLDEE